MRKDSYTILKSKTMRRIVYIFTPEIINMDAANFREFARRK